MRSTLNRLVIFQYVETAVVVGHVDQSIGCYVQIGAMCYLFDSRTRIDQRPWRWWDEESGFVRPERIADVIDANTATLEGSEDQRIADECIRAVFPEIVRAKGAAGRDVVRVRRQRHGRDADWIRLGAYIHHPDVLLGLDTDVSHRLVGHNCQVAARQWQG